MNPAVVCVATPIVFLAGWVSGIFYTGGNTAGGGGGCFGGEDYYPQPAQAYYAQQVGYGRGTYVNNGYSYGRRPFW